VFSANLFSYKAREDSFWALVEAASFLAAVTFFLVPSISPLICLNWASASASAAMSSSKAASMEAFKSIIF